MKIRQFNKRQTDRTIWKYALILLTGLFFVACTNFSQRPDIQDDDALVILTLRTPAASLPKTRVQTDSETVISTVRVLVFEYIGNEYLFSYQVPGVGITQAESQQTRFKALLKSSSNPLKLFILANADGAFGTYSPLAGTTEAAIKKQINLPFSNTSISGNLPMYGEILLPDGLVAGNNTFTAAMLRAIARVDVVKDLVAESPEFILEEAYVFRNYDKIEVIPEALVPSSVTPKVDSPSIPTNAIFLSNPVSKMVPGGTDAITQLYIPESAAATTNAEKLNGTATVVVGGRFGGIGSPITYYRADFDPGIAGHKFGQVLRNYQYVFNIKKVTSAGWNTPEEAANNLASSIIVDVVTWEDFSTDLYFGPNRFAISARDISLRFVKDRIKRLNVESTLTYQIQWLDADGNPTGDATSAIGTTISNNDFDVTIVQDDPDPENVTHLLFRTRNSNYQGNVITDKLRISADNWSIDITVKQDNTAMYSQKHFGALSRADVGGLGTTVSPGGASGEAMRQIIEKQFAPGSVIGIGGFTFDQLSNTYWNPSSANLETTKRIIPRYDVIFLPYATPVSGAVADLLLEWLDENPRRVLIVGADNSSTNINLLNKLTGDGTWLYNIATVSSNFIRASASAATQDFFDGPFGVVTENSKFNRSDNIAGYTLSYSPDVTPLIMADGNTNAMVFGINKNRRIIYHGDCNLYQTNQLSNNNGNVTTDPDRFMANVWAWIVEQLIYGND